MVYKGKFGLDFIETNRHKPLNFGVKGYVDQSGYDIYHQRGTISSCIR